MEKYKKSHIRTMNLKYQLQHGIKNLNYLMDHILYQIFKIIFKKEKGKKNQKLKKPGEKTVNPSIRICKNKIEKRITCKIKTEYYLELLTPETMKLLGITKHKITENGIGENVLYLEIMEVVLVQCNIINTCYQQNSRVLYAFFPKMWFG